MRRAERRRARRGFALLEVLIASIVIVVGFLAVFALQFAALDANVNAMRFTEATNVAEGWLATLHREALMWNQRGGLDIDPATMPNLSRGVVVPAAAGVTGGWVVAAIHDGGEAVDKSTSPGPAGAAGFIYCIHQRITWIDARDANNLFSGEMLRAEVRVLWPRTERGGLATRGGDYADCGASAGAEAMAADIANVVSVTIPDVVAWNSLL